MTYAFTFDASACSGCKACQAACKDKNQLPVGVLWRRVIEVNGGGWEQRGAAWTNTVFAYNLSVACNHCEHPKCAGVCPVDAYVIRPDGIVYINEEKCVGCGYCAWACPYDAPQYNPELGHMTKCNFCYDNLDAGLPPACVAACPLRALGVKEIEEQAIESREQRVESSWLELWNVPAEEHPFPLPLYSRTQPHLAINPHKAMAANNDLQWLSSVTPKSGDFGVRVANYEEVYLRKESAWAEMPLVIFTLLAQMAVGVNWFMSLLLPRPSSMIPFTIIGASLGLGMFFSFAHLGTKKNAWRVLSHLRKSWLSREILMAGLFGLGWLAVTAQWLSGQRTFFLLVWLTNLLGFHFIYSMGQVYRLPSKPAWDSWRTNASFFLSALLLGLLGMAGALAYESRLAGITIPATSWAGIGLLVLAFLAARFFLIRQGAARGFRVQIGFLILGAIGALSFFAPALHKVQSTWIVFLLVSAEETLGRWRFYQSRTQHL